MTRITARKRQLFRELAAETTRMQRLTENLREHIGIANAWTTLTAQEKDWILRNKALTAIEIAQLKVRELWDDGTASSCYK